MDTEYPELTPSKNTNAMSVFNKMGTVVLATLLIGVFAIVSWYCIESFLNANASQCIGPVCIHGPP